MNPDYLRVGAYYAPRPEDWLWRAASAWLGRDAATGAAVAQPAVAGIGEATAEPRRYGFHATLKPPMRLVAGAIWDDVRAAADALAARIAPFALPTLAVAEVHGFLALREAGPCPELQALADAAVAGLDRLRAPPDAAELARRRRGGLSATQEAMLVRWGYPYVFADWFFHMTLTRRLDRAEHARLRPAAAAHLADALAQPRQVSELCLFVQRAPGGDFLIADRLALRG